MATQKNNILAELRVNRLPSLPHLLTEMLEACRGHQASFQDISGIISQDAAVAARVISLANSSFYSRGNKINSLERALLVLGTDTLKTIVITAAIQQFFSGFSHGHTSFLTAFWRHSLTTAMMAKSLAILTSYPNPEEAYVTGLLHNIGELVLESNYPDSYSDIHRQQESGEGRHALEQKALQISHSEVGAWLAQEWELNEFMVDAIAFHHAQADTILDAHHLVKLIYLASKLAEPKADLQSFDIAEELFELNPSLVNEISNKITKEVYDVASSMGIDIDGDTDGKINQQKQVALARQIRNLGLFQTAAGELNRSSSKAELERAFQSALKLLFGYRRSAVFWYNEKSEELSFTPQQDHESVPIKFKLQTARSLVASSALKKQVLCSIDENQESTPVVDQQIIRLMASEGIICIPVQQNGAVFCVLAVGTDKSLAEQAAHSDMLTYFAHEMTHTCSETLKHIKDSENQISAHELTLQIHEIAHEANNPLNIISNYLATLSSKLGDEHEVQEELEILKEEVERTGTILLRLKDLQRTQDPESTGSSDINQEINRLLTLYKGSLFLTHGIECELNLDPALKNHPVNSNCLRQILTNLVKNAVEAMADGGKIKIATLACINVSGRDYVEIIVRDNGPGIPQDIQKNLFKPLSSQKGEGHAGLGLSITKNLVTDAKGTISCRSTNNGTEFQILLPTQQ